MTRHNIIALFSGLIQNVNESLSFLGSKSEITRLYEDFELPESHNCAYDYLCDYGWHFEQLSLKLYYMHRVNIFGIGGLFSKQSFPQNVSRTRVGIETKNVTNSPVMHSHPL